VPSIHFHININPPKSLPKYLCKNVVEGRMNATDRLSLLYPPMDVTQLIAPLWHLVWVEEGAKSMKVVRRNKHKKNCGGDCADGSRAMVGFFR
jgi:hypothetical protein